jgi:DNA polymerase I-like protein with 3'-5' exonuclease and polymerase domains
MYGMGLKRMLDTFGWDAETGQKLWDTYHNAMPFVGPTMKKVGEAALKRATGVIKRGGRIVSYDKGSAWIKVLGGRQLHMEYASDTYLMLNKLNQGSAAVILKEAMIAAYDEGLFDILKLHLQVHDELLLSVPKTFEAFSAALRLQHLMENTVKIKVPILAEPEFGENWYDVPYSLSYDDEGKFLLYNGEILRYKTNKEAFNIMLRLDKRRGIKCQ